MSKVFMRVLPKWQGNRGKDRRHCKQNRGHCPPCAPEEGIPACHLRQKEDRHSCLSPVGRQEGLPSCCFGPLRFPRSRRAANQGRRSRPCRRWRCRNSNSSQRPVKTEEPRVGDRQRHPDAAEAEEVRQQPDRRNQQQHLPGEREEHRLGRLADGLKIAGTDNLEPHQGQHRRAQPHGVDARPGQLRQRLPVAAEQPEDLGRERPW